MRILVTGATGTNGRDVIRDLAGSNAAVRALVRDPAKAGNLAALGAELTRGAFDDPASLDSAMNGIDRLLLLVPADQRMAEFAKTGIAAAERAGVKHIVYFSAVGAGPQTRSHFTRAHGVAEELLKQSGLAWTFLRPNFFMQNLLSSAATITGQNAYYNTFGPATAAYVDTRDIAAVAAAVLTGSGHEGRTYGITGSESLTCDQVAATFSRVLGRQIRYVNVPRDAYKQTLLSTGLPDWLAQAIVDLDTVALNGQAAIVEPTVERLTKRKPRTLEQFVRDNIAAFSA